LSIRYFANADSNGNIIGFYNDDIWDVANIPTTAIEIAEIQWQDCTDNQGKWLVKNGALTLTPLPLFDLEQYKQDKINLLSGIAAEALQTFKSSALGIDHTYLSSSDDMALIHGEYTYLKSDDYLGDLPEWYTIETGNNVEHTKIQFIQVFLDARVNVKTVKYHQATLNARVNACTDKASIDDINW
jgi:hypothetical protein